MDQFLRESKDHLESALGGTSLNIHVVLGNESCDLDSAVSALVWAYYLAKSQESTGRNWDVVIPVLNIPHEDYNLRTEVKHFLSLVNHIGVSSLVFRDDIDLHSQHAAEKLSLTLVDHNTLPKNGAVLDAAVTEVIDHHNNSRHDDPDRDIRVNVEMVGSCSTLVAEKILAENPSILDEEVAQFLLGPILVDTVNLSPTAGKATPKDIAMVEALSTICPGLDKDEMYQELQQAKADMSDFSVQDILRKDFKCVHGNSMNIGMSSIPMHLKEFVEKPEIEDELQQFCTSRNLRLLVVMALTIADDGKTRRQICIYSSISADSMKEELVQTLEQSSVPELLLSELDTGLPELVVYDQGNVKASRKQVLPLVQDFLNGQEDSSQDEEAAEEPKEDLATDSDLKDMNNTLLELSSNTNNANEPVLTDNTFDMGETLAISSPDSSGIDAGSVLLDLDLFPSNQSGMMTSESGAFSSGDSVDTIGITPSTPSSDAVGFGSGTEDLLGLDTFGSVKQSLDFSTADPGSNPFADSSDNTGLDAFMSQTGATSATSNNPFSNPSFSDASTDLFDFSAVPEESVPSTEFTPSSKNPFGTGATEINTDDLLGLDPFGALNDTPSDGTTTLNNPFNLPESSFQATVSTTVEQSVTDFEDFMNPLVATQDTVNQQTSDASTDVQTDTKLVSPEDISVPELTSDPFGITDQLSVEPVGMDTFMSQPSDVTHPDGLAEASINLFDVPEPSAEDSKATEFESSVNIGVYADYHPGSPGSDLVAEASIELDSESLSQMIPAKETTDEESSHNIPDLEDVETEQSLTQDNAATYLAPEITITQTSDNEQEESERDESSVLDDILNDEAQEISQNLVEINVPGQEPETQSVGNKGFSETVTAEVEIESSQRKILHEDENSNLDLGFGDDKAHENGASDEDNDQREDLEDSHEIAIETPAEIKDSTEAYSTSEVDLMSGGILQEMPGDLIVDVLSPETFDTKESELPENMVEPEDLSSPLYSQSVSDSVELQLNFDNSGEIIFDQTVPKDDHVMDVNVADTQIELFQADEDTNKERLPTDEESAEDIPSLSSAESYKEGDEPTNHFDETNGEQEVSVSVSSFLETVPNPENTSVVFEAQSKEIVLGDTEDNIQTSQENEDSHAVLSESIVLESDFEALSGVELQQEKSEEPRFSQAENPQIDFATPASFEDVTAPESTITPNLELEVTGVAEILAKSPSPLSDEAPGHSSGITSPDSDFTSDIISDDPSSGDSYVVTDISHEVSTFRIEDIQEEREEEVEIPKSSGITEVPINVGGPSCEKFEELDEKQLNGAPDVVVLEDPPGGIQVRVIDDYFMEEIPSENGIMDMIPIPTDVGFANSGRSTPVSLPYQEDMASLQKEAHDLVQEAIKMAQFTFLDEVRQKNSKVPNVISADAFEENGIEMNDTEQERASENGDVIGEHSTDIPESVDEILQESNIELELADPEVDEVTEALHEGDVLPAEELNQLEAATTVELDEEPVTETPPGDILMATSAEVELMEPPAEEKTGDIFDFFTDREPAVQEVEISVSGEIASGDAEIILKDETAAGSMDEVVQASNIELDFFAREEERVTQEPYPPAEEPNQFEPATKVELDEQPPTDIPPGDILVTTSTEDELTEPPAEENTEDILDFSTDQAPAVQEVEISVSGETALEDAEVIFKDETAVASVDEVVQASNIELEFSAPEEESFTQELQLPAEEPSQLEDALTVGIDKEPVTKIPLGDILVATSAEVELKEPPAEDKTGDIFDFFTDREPAVQEVEISVSGEIASGDAEIILKDETAAGSMDEVVQASNIDLDFFAREEERVTQEPYPPAEELNQFEPATKVELDEQPATEIPPVNILVTTSAEDKLIEPPAEENTEDIFDSSEDQESALPGIEIAVSEEIASEDVKVVIKDETAAASVDEVIQSSSIEMELAVPEEERFTQEPCPPVEELNQFEPATKVELDEQPATEIPPDNILVTTPAEDELTEPLAEENTEDISDFSADKESAVSEVEISGENASGNAEIILKDETVAASVDEVIQASSIEMEFAVPEEERVTQEPCLPVNKFEAGTTFGLVEEPASEIPPGDILMATYAEAELTEPLAEDKMGDILDFSVDLESAAPGIEILVGREAASDDAEVIIQDENAAASIDEVVQASNIEIEFALPEAEELKQEPQQERLLPEEEQDQVEDSYMGEPIEEPVLKITTDDILEATPAQDESTELQTEENTVDSAPEELSQFEAGTTFGLVEEPASEIPPGDILMATYAEAELTEPLAEDRMGDILDFSVDLESAAPGIEILDGREAASDDAEVIIQDETAAASVDEVVQASNIGIEFALPEAEELTQEPQQERLLPEEEQDQVEDSYMGEPIEEPVLKITTDDILEATPAQDESTELQTEENTVDSAPGELSLFEDVNTVGLVQEPAMEIPPGDILVATSAQDQSTEPPTEGKTANVSDIDQGASEHETTSDVLTESPQLTVKEEIVSTKVLQEESVITRNEEPFVEVQSSVEEACMPANLGASLERDDPPETDLFSTSEVPTESEVPRTGDQKSEDSEEQLNKSQTQELPTSTEEKQELEQEVQPPVEVNVVINNEGLPDISSKSNQEVTDPFSGGKTKLTVEDTIKDVDMEMEDDNRQTSMFGLADILEYVNADGKVESSTSDSYPLRPKSLAIPAKSTPKSGRLLSNGTPGSMFSDTGTPLTPISFGSIDMLTSDTGTDEDILDRDEGEKEQDGAIFKKPLPPAAIKRSVSIDTDVVEDIHGEWDDKKKLMDIIIEKERKKSMGETSERPSPQRTMSFATAEAKKHMEGVELPDEWQDDEFSQQKLAGVDSVQEEDSFYKRRVPSKDGKLRNRDSMVSDEGSVEGMSAWAERLAGDDAFDEDEEDEETSLPAETREQRSWSSTPKKVVPIPAGLSTLSMVGDPHSAPLSPPVLSSPSSPEMSWDDDTMPSPGVEPIPEYTAREELDDRRNWRKVVIGGKEFTLDMRAINPYKKVLSHGGYYGEGVNAIIVLASCYMPDRSRKDYSYIMNNLFIYVLSTLELLVAEDYIIVYFHGAAPKNRIPGLTWMRKCYQMIDRKLRKNLKGLFVVHPTMWLRTIVRLTRPFISSKFNKKLKFVESLDELPALVNMDYIYIPDEVRRFDDRRTQKTDGGGVALWGQYASMALAVTSCSLYIWCLLPSAAAQCPFASYPWLILSDALSWWINSNKERDKSSETDSCYTLGPDSDIATLDQDYINEMLYNPTSRAARRRMSMQLRRGNFALSALLQQESSRQSADSDNWDGTDSHGFIEDDMFADFEDDGTEDEDAFARPRAQTDDGNEYYADDDDCDIKHRPSIGDGELEYEEELDPFANLHPTPYSSHHSRHPQGNAKREKEKPTQRVRKHRLRRHVKKPSNT